MERPLVTAVTHSTDEARVTLTGVPDQPGVAGRVLTALADANVNVDMIIQNEPATEGQGADMSFTVPRADLAAARDGARAARRRAGIGEIATDAAMGKVSLVGAGMKSHPGVAAKTFTRARRRRSQHRDDLDLADQDLVRRARGGRRDGRAASCTRRSSSAPTRSCPRTSTGDHRPVIR